MENQSENISTFSALWQKLALALLSLLVTVLFLVYQGVQSDLKDTQAQVNLLQTNKVNKEDLKDAVGTLNNKIDSAFSNLVSRSASDKQDIIRTMDLYFNGLKNKR